MKTCKTCGFTLPVSDFHRDAHYRENLKSSCKQCVNAKSRAWNSANKTRCKENKAAWEAANRGKVRAYRRKYREANHVKVAASYAEWVAKNPERKEAGRQRWKDRNRDSYLSSCARAGRKWRQENPEKVTANVARRRAKLRAATVDWADHEAMEAFYREARRLTEETGVPHQVDHIIPLQSPFVCGLHNQYNLRVITADENRRKHNRFSPQRQGRLIA